MPEQPTHRQLPVGAAGRGDGAKRVITLSHAEMTRRIAERVELPRNEVAHVLSALGVETTRALLDGRRVRIPGLGLAVPYIRAARAQNVLGRGVVQIPPRQAIRLRLIKELRDA